MRSSSNEFSYEQYQGVQEPAATKALDSLAVIPHLQQLQSAGGSVMLVSILKIKNFSANTICFNEDSTYLRNLSPLFGGERFNLIDHGMPVCLRSNDSATIDISDHAKRKSRGKNYLMSLEQQQVQLVLTTDLFEKTYQITFVPIVDSK